MTNTNSPSSSPPIVPATDITKDALIAAATRDDASAKELLRGSGERSGQVERVRLALTMLQSDLKESKKEEKLRIARAARELMDEHLDTVRGELKTNTDANLEDLEKKMTNARAVAVEEERAATDMLSYESIQLEASEVARDIQQGDWKTWAKYAAAAAVVGISAKWVWDHTIGWLWSKAAGDQKKPGFLRRLAGWTVGLGAAGLGVLGLSRYGRLSNKLFEFGKAGLEGAKDGWEATAGTTLDNIVGLLGDKGRAAEVKRKFDRGEYKTEEEYEEALADALFYDRVEMVWEGSVLHLYRGAEHITLNCTPRLIGTLTTFALNRDLASGQEVFRVYMDGTIAYATTFGGIAGVAKFFQTGGNFKSALITTASESLMWPVQVLKKANDVRYLLFTHEGHVTMQEIRGLPNYYWNRLVANNMNPRNWLGLPQSPERLKGLVAEWQDLKGMIRSIHGTSNKELVESLTGKLQVVEKELMNSVTALKQQRAAGTLGDITSDVRRLLDKGDNLSTVVHTLEEMGDVSGAKVTGLVDEWIAAQRALSEADAAGNALVKSHAEQQLKSIAQEMDETLATLRAKIAAGEKIDGITPAVQKLLDEGTDASKVTRLLQTGSAADETLKAAEEGTEALSGAAKTGKAAATTAEGTEAGADAAKGTKAVSQAAAATEAVTDTVAETGDEWVRAAAQARKALLAPNATDDAAKAIDDAVNACKALGMKSAQAVEAVKDPLSLFALTRTPRQYATALAVANESGDVTQNLRRIGAFLSGFDKLDDAAIAAKVFNPKLLRALSESGLEVESIARFLKTPALRQAMNSADELDDVLKSFIWWEHTKSVGGVINIAGTAISVLMLGSAIVSYREMRQRLTKTIEKLEENLQKAGFEKQGDSFVHPKTKKKISVSLLSENVNNLSTEGAGRIGAGILSVGTGVATIIAPSLALGPVGLAILGIHLTIEAGLTVAEDQRNREFLRDTPASVLAVIGMGQTIGKSEKDVLDESSSWLWSDLINSAETNEKDKALFRKKAVAVMFFQELGSLMKDSPEVPMRILADKFEKGSGKQMDAGSFLDEENGAFWVNDYEKIIKPFLAARLFQMSKDSSVKWSEFRDLKIDEGVFDLENISPADMRLALREAAHLYAQHLKEREYLDQKKKVDENKAIPLDEKILGVQSVDIRAQRTLRVEGGEKDLKAYADQAVFGKKVSELNDGSGLTATERYLHDLTKRLDERANESSAETKKAIDEVKEKFPLGLVPLGVEAGAPRGDERSFMGQKEIFTGKNPGAEGNVRLEDVAGISGRDVERPLTEAEVVAVIDKGRNLYDNLEGVGTWGKGNSVWYAQPSHFQQLKEYSYTLQRAPTLAKEQSVMAFLSSIKNLGEGFSWEDGTFGSDFLAKRNEAFRDALAALRTMNRSLDARTYHLAKVERSSVYTHVLTLPEQKTKLFTDFDNDVAPTMRGDPSALYVEHGGETIEIKPPTLEKLIPGCGVFKCEMQGYSLKGKPAYHYRWTFERAPDAKRGGSELYAYFKSDGAEQPGTKISLPEMKYYKKVMNTELPLVLDDPSNLYTDSRLTITYRDKEGKVVKATGWFTEIIHNHPIGWRGLRNTDPKTKEQATWTRFFPKDGARLIGCTVEYRNKPMTVEYVWKPQQPAPLATDKPVPAKKVNRAA